MRITELIESLVVGESDHLVLDGNNGTRKITFEKLAEAFNKKFGWMSLWGDNLPVGQRRNTWRGKNLGSVVTEKQWDEIGNGTFKDLFLGDYWEIDGHKWRIVDFNYWYGFGDSGQNIYTYHLVIMPDRLLYLHSMNDTDTTEGGYVGSKMYKTGLNEAKNIINNAFGASHVLKHREYLVNTVTNGKPSSGSWYDSTVELPNEFMIYGSHIHSIQQDSSTIPFRLTIDNVQLAGLKAIHSLILSERYSFWLRDILITGYFSRVNGDGACGFSYASRINGVRPVFGICKSNS